MTVINPYINFNGNTEEAFNFYRSVFGGELAMLMRYKDMHAEDELPAGEGEKVMHVALPIGQGSTLMGSDTLEMRGAATAGSNFSIALNPDSAEQAHQFFDGLAAGGQVGMPLGQAPWGGLFGEVTDKYGIRWLVNYEASQQ